MNYFFSLSCACLTVFLATIARKENITMEGEKKYLKDNAGGFLFFYYSKIIPFKK